MSSLAQKQNQAGEKSVSDRGKSVAELRENHYGSSFSRAVGNQGLRRLFGANLKSLEPLSEGAVPRRTAPVISPDTARAPVILQTKLAVNAPGDSFEQEADRVAERVMRVSESQVQRKCDCQGKDCDNCEKQSIGPRIQTKRISGGVPGEVCAPIVGEVLKSAGQALDSSTRAFMESRFGADFGRVRLHTDAKATMSAQSVNASAYTVGNNIVFGVGQYSPGTETGKRLLAHELTHVIQQGSTTSQSNFPTSERVNTGRKNKIEPEESSTLARQVDRSLETPVLQRVFHTVMMRSPLPFSSTVNICHRLLKSRDFKVSKGGLKVSLDARWHGPSEGAASCEEHRQTPYHVTLTQKNTFLDSDYGTCEFDPGKLNNRIWTGVPAGEYYLTISTNNTNPHCCLDGEIDVTEAADLAGESCTQIPEDETLEILHTALDLAGLIPVLGAIPDGINAGIYAIEGDWTSAGISVAAMIPIFGEGVIVTKLGVKVTRKAVQRVGKKGLELGFKEAKATAKVLEKEALVVEKEALKESAEAGGKAATKEVTEVALKRAARYAAEGTIITYNEGKKLTRGLNHAYEAHHILEARHLRNWAFDVMEAPAVILALKDHKEITKRLFKALPAGATYTKAAVWKQYKIIYAEFPNYLKAIEHYFVEVIKP
jgi:hypothetical protein